MEKPKEDVGGSTVTLANEVRRPARSDYARLGSLLLLALLAYLVWRIVEPLWQPLVWAVLLGSLLAPLNSRLTRRLGGRPRLASATTTLLAVLLFLLPVAIVAGAVTAQAAQLLGRLNTQAPPLGAASLDLADWPLLARPLEWLDSHTTIGVEQLQGWFVEAVKRVLQSLASSGGHLVLGALGTVLSFALMLFVLFFVLRDGPALAQKVVRMLPIEERRRSRLWRHLVDVNRAVFMGIGLTALVQGVLVGVGFWIAGLPSPLVFGVVGGFCALIPLVGTTLVWVPGVAVLAVHADYGHATFLAAWGILVVGSVDNFLRPMLISGRTELPTLAVFIGVMGGLSAFGFIGLFLGPIVLGLLVALFRFENEEREAASRAA